MPDTVRHVLTTALRICHLSWKDYRVASAGLAASASIGVRTVFQVAFFTLLGQLTAGDAGRAHAFVGSVAFAPVAAVTSHVSAVVTSEVPQGTMYRLRLGDTPLLVVLLLRSWVYVAEGLAASLLALLVLGPTVLGGHGTADVAAGYPLVLLTTVGCLCTGLFCCALALSGLDEGLVVNVAGYLILLCAGVVVPVGPEGVLHLVGQVLPLGAGLDALRSLGTGTAGELWGAVVHETVVAGLWLLATALLLRLQARRVRAGVAPEPV
ncbi:ABC transporter permease [Streptomyces sp. NBC_01260]|uniref:ABC transporter permease n=1 Tax=unclassified Streptomyces TaxID=2593676 RepID=UPI000F9D27D2|nr:MULTISPECIES: ABC transporter permease [unclassified Streptomyces]MCX4774868.1 ABC transporter permease [Streptomyces sp. NBC_01285]ROQ78314.1 ABC-2 family transporter [Streptomyces sp. CEV 2-1]